MDHPPMSPRSLFLNYRQEDSKEFTLRLHDDLEHVLGAESVYVDLLSIQSGESWPRHLRENLDAAAVVLVVIGKHWLKVANERSSQRRLDERDDWVRTEIEQALGQGKTVIPILVGEAQPPTADVLPPSIAAIAELQMLRISSEDWKQEMQKLLARLEELGFRPEKSLDDRPVRREPSILGVIEYFYLLINEVASSEHAPSRRLVKSVQCRGMTELWAFIDRLKHQKQEIETAPPVRIRGQLSPYAPLLGGHPEHKAELHLKLRQRAVPLIEELGYEWGDLINGLLAYSAGQLVIRPYFPTDYVYLGLYESIVRNAIPVLVERSHYDHKVAPFFWDHNCVEVTLQGLIGRIPEHTQIAMAGVGVTDRLRRVLGDETLDRLGTPSYALFVNGDDQSFIDLETEDAVTTPPPTSRYLDGDIWLANGPNSLITRFVDIASPRVMEKRVREMYIELHRSPQGRGVLASFDKELIPIDDRLPDRVLSSEQL